MFVDPEPNKRRTYRGDRECDSDYIASGDRGEPESLLEEVTRDSVEDYHAYVDYYAIDT
mgnify:CR=1 FL=1